MIVFGVLVIRRYDLLDRFLKSVERGTLRPDRYVVVDNGARIGQEIDAGVVDLPDNTTLISPGRNLGVSGGFNRILETSLDADHIVIGNDDLIYGPKTLEHIIGIAKQYDFLRTPGYMNHATKPKVVERIGFFDENFFPAYCLTPDTPILTEDLRWIPIGDAHVGQVLVGVEEHPQPARRYGARRYIPSTITKSVRRKAPVIRIILSDGREVRCTSDHRWLSKTPGSSGLAYKWRYTRQIQSGYRIAAPLDVWKTESNYSAGYLAGILDGEGCLRRSGDPNNFGLQFSQKKGLVLDTTCQILREMGIPYTSHERKDGVVTIEVNVKRYVLQLLGRVRPVRLLRPRVWEDKYLRSKGSKNVKLTSTNNVVIDAMESAGETEVVTIETTSKTFLANGLVSHNCEDNDYDWRLRMTDLTHFDPQGIEIPGKSGEPEGIEIRHGTWNEERQRFEGSSSLTCLPQDQQGKFSIHFAGALSAYYLSKWGGPPGKEVFTEPFNGRPQFGWHPRPVTELGERPDEPWLRV